VSLWKSMESSSVNTRVSLSELTVVGSDGATEILFGKVKRCCGGPYDGGLEVKTGVPCGRLISNVELFDIGDMFENAAEGTILPKASSLFTRTIGSEKFRGGIPLRTAPKVRRILCRRVGGRLASGGSSHLSSMSGAGLGSTIPPSNRVGGRPSEVETVRAEPSRPRPDECLFLE
jgi:hypothetical protein